MNKPACIVCGNPTGGKGKDFCYDCWKKKESGEIVQCEKCGNWIKAGEKCGCTKTFSELPHEGFDHCVLCGKETEGVAFCKECYMKYPNHELLAMLNGQTKAEQTNTQDEKEEKSNNRTIIVNAESKSKCITCGRHTDGLLFCPICYQKFHKKQLIFRITECSKVQLLDSDYENIYECDDGHIVKSKSERDIDNYLYAHKIIHAYEKAIAYSEKDELHPDFFLPNYLGDGKDVYIEHWGYSESNIEYTESKNFKLKIYRELCKKKKMTLICTHETTDAKRIRAVLDRKLDIDFIKENEINGEDT